MTLNFVNHASLVFSHGDIRLITDPWISGEVFHNGWSLLSKTKFTFSDFKNITHIWFSHEHPDHFFPPNIKSIPPKYRESITVLYQKSEDKKVVKFCEKLKFKEVKELTPNEVYKLGDDFSIINAPFGHDSWLFIKTREFNFLNTNDCVINKTKQAVEIKNIIGDVDVLLTQFSYASKHGNANEPEKRQRAVADKKAQMSLQFNVFKPKYFIPIASFIWYSHEENFYMNDQVHTINQVYNFALKNKVTPIVLYPMDTYEVGSDHENTTAINKYLKDLKNVNFKNTRKTDSVPVERIKDSAKKLNLQLVKEDFLSFFLISFFPIKFYLTDLNKVVQFSSLFGLKEIQMAKDKANVFLSSEVLDYCFKFNWGFGTTHVNARFQTNTEKDLKLFNYYISVTDSLNHRDSTLKRVISKIKRGL